MGEMGTSGKKVKGIAKEYVWMAMDMGNGVGLPVGMQGGGLGGGGTKWGKLGQLQ